MRVLTCGGGVREALVHVMCGAAIVPHGHGGALERTESDPRLSDDMQREAVIEAHHIEEHHVGQQLQAVGAEFHIPARVHMLVCMQQRSIIRNQQAITTYEENNERRERDRDKEKKGKKVCEQEH